MWPFTSSSASSDSGPSTHTTPPAPVNPPAAGSNPSIPPGADKCPVDHSTRTAWLAANASNPDTPHPFHPTVPSSSSSSSSQPTLDTRTARAPRLSHDRVISSIPRSSTSPLQPSPEPSSQPPLRSTSSSSSSNNNPFASSSTSSNQIPPASHTSPNSDGSDEETTGKWVYPSEQQFFNAMLRKNHKPKAEDMRTIVPIHNAVNEKAWEEVMLWEAGMGSERCGGPRLVSFVGRPRDRTPKAWLMTALGYAPPFDRHDWLVDRCGTHVRYVIDFYTGKHDPNRKQNMAFYLDVRPAVDNWEGIKTRLAGWWR